MPIENSFLEQARIGFSRHVAPHRHSGLLAALVFAIAVRPLIGDTGAGSALFGVAMVLLLLVALYNINVDELVGDRSRLLTQSRRRRRLGWVLAIAAGLERAYAIFGHNHLVNVVGLIFWLLFIVFVTLSQLRSVLKQRQVTNETICMAISVYLLLGLAGLCSMESCFNSIRTPLPASPWQNPVSYKTFCISFQFSATSA